MTYHGIPSGILSDILSGISSHMSSGILSGISSGILSDILSGILSGISSGILSGRWGPAVPTELGRSQVGPRCPLGSEGPWLRSSGAHWARKVPGWGPLRSEPCGWGPGVPTQIGSWQWRPSSGRSWRTRRGRKRRRRTIVVKSNNPHLAGGEKP